MTSIIPSIPLRPQKWNRNPEGYVKHQHLLVRLVQWLETQGAVCQLPPETDGWDRGIDLIVNGTPVDLKGFGLRSYGSSYTWDSTYYRGRSRPIYDGTLTQWFIHPTDGDPSEWIVGSPDHLRTSKYGYAPYYLQADTFTMSQLLDRHML